MRVRWVKLYERNHLEDQEIHESIMLKLILRKWMGRHVFDSRSSG